MKDCDCYPHPDHDVELRWTIANAITNLSRILQMLSPHCEYRVLPPEVRGAIQDLASDVGRTITRLAGEF
jgi:hypothetical protein